MSRRTESAWFKGPILISRTLSIRNPDFVQPDLGSFRQIFIGDLVSDRRARTAGPFTASEHLPGALLHCLTFSFLLSSKARDDGAVIGSNTPIG